MRISRSRSAASRRCSRLIACQMKSARLLAAPLETCASTNSTISSGSRTAICVLIPKRYQFGMRPVFLLQRPEEIVGVDDGVRVALFGEEALAVGGVLG